MSLREESMARRHLPGPYRHLLIESLDTPSKARWGELVTFSNIEFSVRTRARKKAAKGRRGQRVE